MYFDTAGYIGHTAQAKRYDSDARPLIFLHLMPLPPTYYSPRGADLHADLPIQRQHAVAVRRRAEFRTHPPPPRRSHALRRRHREPLYAGQDVDQRIDAAAGKYESGLAGTDQFRNPADIGADDRPAERTGFHDADGRVLIPFGRYDDGRSRGNGGAQRRSRQITGEFNVAAQLGGQLPQGLFFGSRSDDP